MASASYRFELGTFDVLIVKDGSPGTRPLSDLVEVLPDALENTEIFMESGLMVVDTPLKRFLVDAGNGDGRGPRSHTAKEAFEKEGIPPQSIDTVLLTHGDPDHVHGLLTQGGDLVYTHAHYVLHIDLWRAMNTDLAAGLYFESQTEFMRRLATLIEGRSTLFEVEREIWPGIRAIPAPGHRAGHAIYRFDSEASVLFHIGDAAFDPIFLEHPDLLLAMEYKPDQARNTRTALARRLLAEHALIVGSHFSVANVGSLRGSTLNHQFQWEPQSPG